MHIYNRKLEKGMIPAYRHRKLEIYHVIPLMFG